VAQEGAPGDGDALPRRADAVVRVPDEGDQARAQARPPARLGGRARLRRVVPQHRRGGHRAHPLPEYGINFEPKKFLSTLYSWLLAAGETFLVEPIIILAVYATPRYIDWAMLPHEPKPPKEPKRPMTLDDLKGLKKSRVQRILKDRVEGGLMRSKAPPRSPEISLPGSPEMRRGKLSLAGTSRKNVADF